MQPRFNRTENGAEISTDVDTREDAHGLTTLRFGGHRHLLKIQHIPAGPGTPVRVPVPSRQVAIVLEAVARTSFQPIFAGRISEILEPGASFVDVRLDVGCSAAHCGPGSHSNPAWR